MEKWKNGKMVRETAQSFHNRPNFQMSNDKNDQ
jgi:hypothetical protein